jgi:hypothetical protein
VRTLETVQTQLPGTTTAPGLARKFLRATLPTSEVDGSATVTGGDAQ